MRWNSSTRRRRSLVFLLIAGLGLVASGCGENVNSVIPTPTKTAPPASEWKGLYNGSGSDPYRVDDGSTRGK
jgi:hypothetical protein